VRGGIEIIHANAHDLSMFADASFDLILCNSMLEHDPLFWRTLGEVRRLVCVGGWSIIGVPGYAEMGMHRMPWLQRQFCRMPIIGRKLRDQQSVLGASSLTLGIHNFPGDYYRFSEQAMREVLLAEMVDVSVETLLMPPRLIGCGRKAN
jgi:SAM-dependent methyltransferase